MFLVHLQLLCRVEGILVLVVIVVIVVAVTLQTKPTVAYFVGCSSSLFLLIFHFGFGLYYFLLYNFKEVVLFSNKQIRICNVV